MNSPLREKTKAITKSGLTIYDSLKNAPNLFLTNDELESILASNLQGLNLAYKLRTRSKVLKTKVCEALGYPVPKSFKKAQPRFIGQDFDTYIQKSNNLQIWNEEISPTRRYVLVRLNDRDVVTSVKVITGEAIAKYDKAGTLTSKFQARRKGANNASLLVSPEDTDNFRRVLKPTKKVSEQALKSLSAASKPESGKVLSIEAMYKKIQSVAGTELEDPGLDQERKRGIALQRLVCEKLGLQGYADNGQMPDILAQALEVKLQTSPTIDLGLISPDSEKPARDLGVGLNHCDIRYAVIYAEKSKRGSVKVKAVVVTTGQDFFKEFDKFAGRVVNRKLQIRIPPSVFTKTE